MAHRTVPVQSVPALTTKLYDSDSDIRYMSLADLRTVLTNDTGSTGVNLLSLDFNQQAKIVDGLLHTLDDPNGEVQNLAIKCLGPFVQKAHAEILSPMLVKLANLHAEDSSVDNSIAALAVREVVVSLPHPGSTGSRGKSAQDAYNAISKVLIPRLTGQGLLYESMKTGVDSNFLDVVIEIARCFGPALQHSEVEALQNAILPFLESDKVGSALRKKSVLALSTLSLYFTEAMLSNFISSLIEHLTDSHLTLTNRKTYLTLLGSMARTIPKKFGPHLKTLTPFVLAVLSQGELDEQMQGMEEDEEERDLQVDETREIALVTLESFLSACPSDMRSYTEDSIDSCLRFLRYDPNVAEDVEDDEAEDDETLDGVGDDFEMDEDFVEEGGLDDEDDVSWKVRRSAAKAVYTLISTRISDILERAELYDRIARELIDRFKEREESVRLEVLSTLSLLVRKSDVRDSILSLTEGTTNGTEKPVVQHIEGRKRRRGGSDTVLSDTLKAGRFNGAMSPEIHSPSSSGLHANLARVGPSIIRGALRLLTTSPQPTKQASTVLLKDLIVVQAGTELEALDKVLGSVIGVMSTMREDGVSISGSNAVTETSLQIETLKLLAEIAKNNSSRALQPHLPQAVSSVLKAAKNKSPKVSIEALKTAEQITMAITPPRTASDNQHAASQLEALLRVFLELVQARNIDLTVRQEALHGLGVLLGRTSGPRGTKLVPSNVRAEALNTLLEASKNETMRYAAIKSIDVIASFPSSKSDFEATWFSNVCLEIGAQLRKADRSLRGAGLGALRSLLNGSDRCHYLDASSSQELRNMLLPLIASEDLHLLGPALLILGGLIQSGNIQNLDDDFKQYFSTLVRSSSAVSVLDQLCLLVEHAGQRGIGQPFMQTLLRDIGVAGSPAVVGKVIGTLLVFGGNNIGVSVDDFLKELKSTTDEKRKCLALAVLGEVGLLRSGVEGLTPDLFFSYFDSKSSDTSLAAAVALGRVSAGAGDASSAISAILTRAKAQPQQRYLLLHSVKEFLLHVENKTGILRYKDALWDAVVSNSESEENRTIGAECVASLAMLDPETFLPLLQVCVFLNTNRDNTDVSKAMLNNDTAAIRGTGILALRDILSGSESGYDKYLRPIIVEMLSSMMKDVDLDNRRSAMNTFNAAARNKSAIILPYLSQLLPLVMQQTYEDPSLIREVSMGPFKHKVDDGLEVRKVSLHGGCRQYYPNV